MSVAPSSDDEPLDDDEYVPERENWSEFCMRVYGVPTTLPQVSAFDIVEATTEHTAWFPIPKQSNGKHLYTVSYMCSGLQGEFLYRVIYAFDEPIRPQARLELLETLTREASRIILTNPDADDSLIYLRHIQPS
jgi:hypothetical protein